MNDVFQQAFSSVSSITLIVLLFGGSIFVHELGHFLAARRRGLHVERFSIGFGPKLFSWTRDGVEYRLSLLPLGGYVALPQLADMRGIEGESAEADRLPPIGYASKMIVAVMGAVFNVLFAFVLACGIWVFGLPTTEMQTTTTIGYVTPTVTLPDGSEITSPAAEAGLREGDTILAIDGKSVSDWGVLQQTLVSSTGRDAAGRPFTTLTISRDGVERRIGIHPRLSGEEEMRKIGIVPAEPILVRGTALNSPAALAGLQPGDRILRVDGAPYFSRWKLEDFIAKNPDRDLLFTFEREGRELTANLRAVEVVYTTDGLKTASVGIDYLVPRIVIHPTPLRQMQDAATTMYRVLSALLHPKSDLGIGQMSGPPGIVRALYATSQVDVRLAIWITILININLAIFNLLPIPVLDGGHMLFATIARLRRRALPPRLIVGAQSAFMVLLFSLMLFVSFRDITRWSRDAREDRRIERTYIAPVFPAPAER